MDQMSVDSHKRPKTDAAGSKDESKERRPFIGGNWKSNGDRKFLKTHIDALNDAAKKVSDHVEVVVAPMALHLDFTLSNLSPVFHVSAQNCSATANGAFTGEISASALKDANIHWVILGHSERRSLYNESDAVVAKKVAIALKENLNIIACIGETLEQRKADKTFDVVFAQLKAITDVVKDWKSIVIAYEPVWAIGTGVVATPAQAQAVHAALRKWLSEHVSSSVGATTRIIYGGSVKSDNCNELMKLQDVDGFLVGGASLVAKDFLTIVESPRAVGRVSS